MKTTRYAVPAHPADLIGLRARTQPAEQEQTHSGHLRDVDYTDSELAHTMAEGFMADLWPNRTQAHHWRGVPSMFKFTRA